MKQRLMLGLVIGVGFALPTARASANERCAASSSTCSRRGAGENARRLGRLLYQQDPELRRILRGCQDLSLFAHTPSSQPVPPGRVGDNLADDRGFQHCTQQLVDAGTINARTAVIIDTGHNIPAAHQLLQNRALRCQGVFSFPHLVAHPGLDRRVLAQASSWGNEIAGLQAQNARSGVRGALFMCVESHRMPPITDGPVPAGCRPLNARAFPSAQDLRNLGLDNVVYLKEAPPQEFHPIAGFAKADLAPYLLGLEASGLPVACTGIDPRRCRGDNQR